VLKITVGELAEWRQRIDKGVIRELDHPINSDGGTVHEVIADPAPQPDARLPSWRAARASVYQAIARLPASRAVRDLRGLLQRAEPALVRSVMTWASRRAA
jgi:hypothetical protein